MRSQSGGGRFSKEIALNLLQIETFLKKTTSLTS